MAFVDDVKHWTDLDAAAAALGRALGIFPPDSKLSDVKAVLWTNSAAGNSLYGMLERLCWLGVLEQDDGGARYRAAPARLHPLGERDDVPALAAGPPPRAQINLSVEEPEGVCLAADRAGYRYLARVFDEIASSALESGWQSRRDQAFGPGASPTGISLVLVDPEAEPA
jgi:hypothetical protein